ncbi:SDR family oxidoreductase [Azohydromonas aeria]|uniref:SDR family oxidoreductase n=1 Tax=Azohydromonas aeria TaxID=2590212 RepID=UPI0012F964C6|nr:SDR family oxidoreductase [Azohydromonas aeria]
MDGLGTLLITGGSRGIGAATARLAACSGYDVCLTYASRPDAAQAVAAEVEAAGRRALCVQADARDADFAERVLAGIPEAFGPLVGLVNNAGITGPLGAFPQAKPETLRAVFEVNVLSLMLLTQRVVQRWQAQGQGGCVVNVSSVAATLGSPGEYVHYAASKAAVETFTVGLGKELAAQGIRVNCVSPGTTLTDIHAAMGDPGRPQRVAARIPMQRPGHAEEIAEAIIWLLSDKAAYVTGTVLKVAGGM